MSRNHIIAIIRGWLFNSNLKYIILLNEINLNWCAGHQKPGIHVVGINEQIQICIKQKNCLNKQINKEKNKEKTKKTKKPKKIQKSKK